MGTLLRLVSTRVSTQARRGSSLSVSEWMKQAAGESGLGLAAAQPRRGFAAELGASWGWVCTLGGQSSGLASLLLSGLDTALPRSSSVASLSACTDVIPGAPRVRLTAGASREPLEGARCPL